MDVVSRRFEEFGFPLKVDRNVIPDDDTTLFVCSGMQNLKPRFRNMDGGVYGSIQSCVRTNDLELVGDGTHLTHFEMIGNFSFGGPSYETSVSLWDSILRDLELKVVVHVYPTRDDHRILWTRRGYETVNDEECVWSDGSVGGNCCEIYFGSLEIGNLVNPLDHSTDVGFGLERLVQVLEGKCRVDETSLFDQRYEPQVRDHIRTLRVLKENGISPGIRGREYVCRRLLRRSMRLSLELPGFEDWVEKERELLDRRMKEARKMLKRHRNKSPEWWWETVGILPEELNELRG